MAGHKTFQGLPVSPGIAVANAVVLERELRKVNRQQIREGTGELEVERLRQAIQKTRRDLENHRSKAMASFGEIVAKIFDAHLLILDDEPTFDQIEEGILTENIKAEYALFRELDHVARNLSAQQVDIFRDRAQDVRDVCRRILNHLDGSPTDSMVGVDKYSILVAAELNPSDILHLDPELIIGVVTDAGGATSHTAILTRILGVPSVVGLRNFSKQVKAGDLLVVNGNSGKIIQNPTAKQFEKYTKKQSQYRSYMRSLSDIHQLEAQTTDGHSVTIAANIELPDEAHRVIENGGDGVGLFRTEYLFLAKGGLPDEEEQYREYIKVAEILNPKPVIIRTFDMGGDKAFPGIDFPHESNPFMGWRAIRVGLEKPEMLRTQFRAILRASIHKNVSIMFPMISDLNELQLAKEIFHEVQADFKQEGIAFDDKMKVGIMVEVPSVAVMAHQFAKYVDFFSIGTNDLVQFTLAVDRGNEQIAHLYKPWHPAILHLIKHTVDAANSEGIHVGVCGEFAGNPLATLLLIGLGVQELSSSPSRIPQVKKIIRSASFEECENLAHKVMDFDTSSDVYDFLLRYMKKRFADMPIWFGNNS